MTSPEPKPSKTINELFDSYHPRPSARFYQRLSGAPWIKKEKPMQTRSLYHRSRWAGVLVGIAVVLALASVGLPTARAEILAWLGLGRAPGNQVPVVPSHQLLSATDVATLNANPTPVLPTATAQPQGLLSTQAPPTQLPTPQPAWPSYTAAQQADFLAISGQAGWMLLAPGWLPDGYHYESVYYDANNHLLFMTFTATRPLPGSDGLTETKSLTLTEALHNDLVPLEVAPETQVENISVGSQAAAYALGAWDSQYDQASGKMIATWRDGLPLQNVFWQAGPVYLVLISDDAQVSKTDLIRAADSVR